jgi:hypothetical protein
VLNNNVKEKQMFKKIFTLILLFSFTCGSAFASIDILVVMTPDGKSDYSLSNPNTSIQGLINNANSIFQQNGLSTNEDMFRLVGVYDLPNMQTYLDSRIMHQDLINPNSNNEWAKDVRQKREIYGADIAVVIYGNSEALDTTVSAGQGPSYGPNGVNSSESFAIAYGYWVGGNRVLEHELGHVLGLLHEHGTSNSIMTTGGRTYLYSETSKGIINTNKSKLTAFRTRNSDSYLWSPGFSNGSVSKPNYLSCGTKNIKSTVGSSDSTQLNIQNYSNDIVKVYWLDYAGKEKLVFTLDSFHQNTENTFTTHPWILKANGECIGIVNNLDTTSNVIRVDNR